MSFVFISYSTQNASAARSLSEALSRAGIAFWMAPQSIAPGEDYTEALAKALKTCDRVILLLSRQSNASRYVRREIHLALSNAKHVIPVRLEAFELQGGLEFLISSSQFVDATAIDSAEWLPRVISAATEPVDQPPRALKSSGFFRLDMSMLALTAASIASFIALILSALPTSSVGGSTMLNRLLAANTSPAMIGIGLFALLAIVLATRRFSKLTGRQIVIRFGDVITLIGVAIGTALFAGLFLLTPLIATALVGLAYLPLRRLFIRRWGTLAMVVSIVLVASAWLAEGRLYGTVLSGKNTVAVVPKCGQQGCSPAGRQLYQTLVQELNDLLQGEGAGILPTLDPASYNQFFDNAPAFTYDRPRAHRINLIANRKLFDNLAFVTLEEANCGEPKLHFTLESAPIRRSAPLWSTWRLDRKTNLGGRNTVDGFMPLGDEEAASLLLAGLILEHVIDIGPSDPELLRQYLRSARERDKQKYLVYLPDSITRQLESGAFETADPAQLDETFEAVVHALDTYATDSLDPEACEDGTSNAAMQFALRMGVAKNLVETDD